MKKLMKVGIALLAVVAFGVLCAIGAESKYSTSATGTNTVTFGPSHGGFKVTGLYVTADTNPCQVIFYARGTGAAKYAPSVTPTNGQSVIWFTNPSSAVTTGNHVVYMHANGTVHKTTVTAGTATNATLAAALSTAGATGDYLYEIVPAFQMTYAGTAISEFGGNVFAVPGDTPLSIQIANSGTNSIIGVTTDK